jgi:thioesterase domain-containing protein
MEGQIKTPRHEATSGYNTPLVPIRPTGTQNPLFIVPGGLVTPDYELEDAQFLPHARLVQALGGDRPVYGLRTLGLGGRLETFSSIEDLASEYATAVQSLRPRGPYLLAGFCVGGVFAYEIARQLSSRSVPGRLVLVDAGYPGERWNKLLKDDMKQKDGLKSAYAKYRIKFSKLINIIKNNKLRLHRSLGDIAAGLSSSLKYKRSHQNKSLILFKNEYNHLLKLCYKYRPQPYDGRIVLVATGFLINDGLHLGWEELALGGVDLHRIPGSGGAYATEYLETTAEIITSIDNRRDLVQRSQDRGGAPSFPGCKSDTK